MHKTSKSAYLKSDSFLVSANVRFVLFIFFDGILYNSSCTNPAGHIKPHTTRPNNVPMSKKKPVIKNGSCPFASVFCREPSGQAAIAPGHE